jgi:F0F1-type ATP synthase membrane subunit b/b'
MLANRKRFKTFSAFQRESIVGDILTQLKIDETFFIQLGLIFFIVTVLSFSYFKPFYVLFEQRHKRTSEDLKAAEETLQLANAKLAEYKQRIHDERVQIRQELENAILNAKKEEATLLGHARSEAKAVVQEAQQALDAQRSTLKASIAAELDGMAQVAIDKLVGKGGV